MEDLIHQVSDHIWVGGDACYSSNLKRDLKIVNKMDVIIDVRSEDERDDNLSQDWIGLARVSRPPKYWQFEMFDDLVNENPTVVFHDLLEMVGKLQRQKGRDINILIHCHMGVNRATSVAMFLMIVLDNMQPEDAFTQIRGHHRQAHLAYALNAVAAAYTLDDVVPDGIDLVDRLRDFQTWEKTYWLQHRKDRRDINDWIADHHEFDDQMVIIRQDSDGNYHVTKGSG